MKFSGITLLVACAAGLCAAAATAGTPVYKWTDAEGVVHYSDKAPAHAAVPVKILELTALPPVNPEAVKREQAYIASVNQWYQQVLNRQTQLQYAQYLAWQENQPGATPAPGATTEVSYVSPLCWNCGRLWHRRPYFPHPGYRGPETQPPVFKSNLWNTQPSRFTQSLYHPQ